MSVVTKKMTRQLKQQFINGISNEEMMTEIINEFTEIKESNTVTIKQVLCWAKKYK